MAQVAAHALKVVGQRERPQSEEVHGIHQHFLVMDHLHHPEDALLLHSKDRLAEKVAILVQILPRRGYLLKLEGQKVRRDLISHLSKFMHGRRVHEEPVRLVHPLVFQQHTAMHWLVERLEGRVGLSAWIVTTEGWSCSDSEGFSLCCRIRIFFLK